MTIKRKVVPFLISALIMSLILPAISPISNHRESNTSGAEQTGTTITIQSPVTRIVVSGIVHGPIAIDGDTDFNATAEAEGWTGEGTEDMPYIIENLDIDVDGGSSHCIDIQNTRAHFIVRDCYLEDALANGVNLENVTNFVIENNIVVGCQQGIYLQAENGSVADNDIDALGGFAGIRLNLANDTSLSGNTVKDGSYGIYVGRCERLEVTNLSVSGFSNEGMHLDLISNCTFTDCSCLGIGSGIGINLGNSADIYFARNTINDTLSGFRVILSDNTEFSRGVIRYCTANIYAQDVLNLYVWGCVSEGAASYGAWVLAGAVGARLYFNIFKNNSDHVRCQSTESDVEYNYYDDYTGIDANGDGFGDVAYPLSGGVGEYDYNPIVYDSIDIDWSVEPTDQALEFGESLNYDLDTVSVAPTDSWTISDTAHFIVDADGIISNKFQLAVGVYPIDVTATTVLGFSVEGIFTVTVADTVSPVFMGQVKNRTFAYGAPVEFQMIAQDLSGIDHWDLSDTQNFSLMADSFGETSVATIEAAGALDPGEYPLVLTVHDKNWNSVTAELYVIVEEQPAGGGMDFGFYLSAAGTGIAVVALILSLITFLGSRKEK
jgi:parallel beta-helix repeat protein